MKQGIFRAMTIEEFASLKPGDTLYAYMPNRTASAFTVKGYPFIKYCDDDGLNYYVDTTTFTVCQDIALVRED